MKINPILLVIFTVIAVVFPLVFFAWIIVDEKPPQFFPLGNKNARYTLVKKPLGFQGWDEISTPSANESMMIYYVEYRGKNVFGDRNDKDFFRIAVGNSRFDIEPLEDKNIIIEKGEFVSSSKQCIAEKCINLNGPYAVLDIEEIRLFEQ